MDKYEKRAMEWCPDNLDHACHSDKYPCKAIAAALRESAAQAFEEAARGCHNKPWVVIRNNCELKAEELRAAALRSTTRGKGA